MQILRGKGKIYDINENYIDEVTYDIYDRSSSESFIVEWQGEITPGNGIMPVGNHIIELDDGRRGACIISIKATSSFGLVVDRYNVEGISPLKRQKESGYENDYRRVS